MTILGLGNDIVEIQRIARVFDRFGDLLGRRVLSKSEWYQYKAYKQPVRFLAKIFAIKEAAAKALGTGMRRGLSFKQIEVYKDTLGKPCLHFLEQAKVIANQLGVNRVHVTVSDERYYAYAVVIVEN